MATYEQKKQTALHLLRRAISFIKQLNEARHVERLQEATRRLEQGTLMVVVVGEFRRGKSSLLNAFLDIPWGQELFPVDITVTTSITSMISYGPTERIEVLLGDDNSDDVQRREITRSEIHSYVTEQGNPRNRREARLLQVQFPHEQLRQGLVLVDTPGIGALYAHHTDVTYSFLPNADAVLFVSDVLTPLTEAELLFIKERILPYTEHLFFVLTKIDRVKDYQPILASNRQKLAATLNCPPSAITIIPVSSSLKRSSLQTQDAESLAESNFPELTSTLWRFVGARRERILIVRALMALNEILDEVLQPLQIEHDASQEENQQELDQLEASLKETQSRLRQLEMENAQWQSNLYDALQGLTNDAYYELEKGFTEIQRKAPDYITDEVLDEPELVLSPILGDINQLLFQIDTLVETRAASLHETLRQATDLDLKKASTEGLYGRGKPMSAQGLNTVPYRTIEQASFIETLNEGARMSFGPGIVGDVISFAQGIPFLGTIVGGTAMLFGVRSVQKKRMRQIQQRDRAQIETQLRAVIADQQRDLAHLLRKNIQSLRIVMRDNLLQQIKYKRDKQEKTLQALQETRQRSRAEVAVRLQALRVPLQQGEQLLAENESQIEGNEKDGAVKDFFISYEQTDWPWAKWIAQQLEEAGYSTVLPERDFLAGSNYIQEKEIAIKHAERIIAVLSPDYLTSIFTPSEWASAFRRDPTGEQRLLLPVRVRACDVQGLLGAPIYIDLVDKDKQKAQEALLAGVQRIPGLLKKPSFPLYTASELALFPGTQPASSRTHAKPARYGAPFPAVWNVPRRHVFYFTGRDRLLEQLLKRFSEKSAEGTATPQALAGLGGIGKTQTAAEYAYRHREAYQTVLWVRAGTQGDLVAGFQTIADMLKRPLEDLQDQSTLIRTMQEWFMTHTDWLLILDNANDPNLVTPFLPLSPRGHVLLTTQNREITEVVQSFLLEPLGPEDGALCILRRTGNIRENEQLNDVSPARAEAARELSRLMNGLPLALEQAGAYIEDTDCGVNRYLALYRQYQFHIQRDQYEAVPNYPQAVANAWRFSRSIVKQEQPAAFELLQFCTFLAPEPIPEEIFTKGGAALGSTLGAIVADLVAFDRALSILRRYCLLNREVNREGDLTLFSIHPTIQEILQDEMDESTQQLWAQRVVCAVAHALPSVTWQLLQAHARRCVQLIEQRNMTFPEAALVRRYVEEAGNMKSLVQRTLAIYEQRLELAPPDTLQSLNTRAVLYQKQGKYAEAEPLYQRALAIYEQQLGPEHPDTATGLSSLASLYVNRGRYMEAEPLYQRALAIYEQQLGPEHPDTVTSLSNLANLYVTQGKYAEAETLFQRTLWEKPLGVNYPYIATSLSNLASLYVNQGKYAEAEPLLLRVLHIWEQELGSAHPDTIIGLSNLASLYVNQGKYAEAEALFQRALEIREQQLGPKHPDTATSLSNLASLYVNQGKYAEAEALFQHAILIDEQAFGVEHPEVATNLNNLAAIYERQGKYAQAEEYYQRALAILEQQRGAEHPDVSTIFNNLASVFQETQRYAEAEALYRRALQIDQTIYGDHHTVVAADFSNFGTLLYQTRRYTEAEHFFRLALEIDRSVLGENHPTVRVRLKNLSLALLALERQDEANDLFLLLGQQVDDAPSFIQEQRES